MRNKLKRWASDLKRELLVLWLAVRSNRVPLAAKVLAALVVLYALSPVDLIPDFIPVLGYLDDLILLPLGIWLVLKLIPASVLEDLRIEAERRDDLPSRSWLGLFLVCAIWVSVVLVAYLTLWGR